MSEGNSKIYKLKNITDLCSNNGLNKPEFRLTEIKSLMRFWWRALNFYTNASTMRKEEENIFGNSDTHNSPIIFKTESNGFKYNDGIHEVRKNNKPINCFKSGKIVEVKLSVYKRKISQKEYINKELYFYDNLLKISLILGGIGKRSRRGCGVFMLEENDKECNLKNQIKSYMENLNVNKYYEFSKENNKYLEIVRKDEYRNKEFRYPYIEEIIISKEAVSEEYFYIKIKESIDATRNEKFQYKDYKCGKLACPVYVTCYGDPNELYPIIVKLYNTNPHETYDNYYKKFKEVILCSKE
ncbi:type III-B CRISPR module RAMP protein Cmr1 [Clostridium sp. ATCC 25772]|uniref:type III-B CRISPR module RAMP protein Cmr1 n=1 Tax=Clostridium sp. ATCC 25772 TaxID=1676991 RepID=UPI00078251CF|nr:type III-B CRISPR module RAMP protein Cmr1 [Clostridium sp. ATCC 25772]